MIAHLDHIGIAVADAAASLAFFRDCLGLEVHGVEEVASQHVRAHFVAVGPSNLELLEATAPDSPIGRFLAKRGPGLHHITLRVDDIRAALSHLRARGVRLVDDEPRAGAEQALVAFIHPSSAHGVLVELKQTVAAPELHVSRATVGDLEVIALYDGRIRLDGGAMFGVVPRTLWESKAPADVRHRITLAMRPILIRGDRTVLVDAGIGDKESDKFYELYGADRTRHLDHALAEAGIAAEDIDLVVATHLHFDHAGGFTMREAGGAVRPRFPRARYVVRRGEWEDAMHPHERNRASYLPHNFVPLQDAGVLDFVDDDVEVVPGVRVQRTGGHTQHHQIVWIESGGQRAVFAADLMPTAAHLPDPWIMGYDLYPMDTLAAKKAFSSEVSASRALVFFEHDPAVTAAFIVDQAGRRTLQRHL
ncbi:MAG: methylmalonyl-CoA epimerase [Vicinamibacterales bacterium]